MPRGQKFDIDYLRTQRNAAQAELERYILEQFPIDSREKEVGVAKRSRAVTDIEEVMRHEVLQSQARS